MRELTPKQQRFVEEYLIDLNATGAARRAGYSVKTAEQQGARLLGNVKVNAAVAAGRQRLADRAGRSVDDVMADIGRVRASCMQQVIDPDFGTLVLVNPKEALKALELEGKHLGAFERDNRQKNPLGAFDVARFFGDIFRRPAALGSEDEG